ncbi:MAG: PilZ domain-containing protein [Candidatus Omnitrophica bacterium]|nr:PilZ domain-containing protein [Candidatus Omnitrophota bacterium]
MQESREWRRIAVDISAHGEVLAAPIRLFASKVVNVNPDGICFTAPEGLLPGQEVRLVMDLPGEGRMEARLKVGWAGFFEQDQTFRAGGKFEALPEREKEKFQRFYHLKLMSLLGG